MTKEKTIVTENIGEDSTGTPYIHMELDEFGGEAYLRADGDYDIPVDLTDEELATIARAAHLKNMSLNDYMVEALSKMLDDPEIEQKLLSVTGETVS